MIAKNSPIKETSILLHQLQHLLIGLGIVHIVGNFPEIKWTLS